jgi:hypothetical protein
LATGRRERLSLAYVSKVGAGAKNKREKAKRKPATFTVIHTQGTAEAGRKV